MSATAPLIAPCIGFARSLVPLVDVVGPYVPWVPGYEIRPIRFQELEAIAETLPAPAYRTHEDDLNWQRTGAVTVMVAWEASAPIGTGIIHWPGPRDPGIAELLPDCPEIFRLEVRAALRSRGFGAALVHTLESLARARGFARIGLGVGIANLGARRLYERLGYRPAETPRYVDRSRRPGSDGQPIVWEELCLYMTKELAPLVPVCLAAPPSL